jgi:hypothetical protein
MESIDAAILPKAWATLGSPRQSDRTGTPEQLRFERLIWQPAGPGKAPSCSALRWQPIGRRWRAMENAPIPARRALAALDKPPAADVDTSVPARRISKKVRTAIGYMVNGECKQISEARRRSGSPAKPCPAPCRSPTSPSTCANGWCGTSLSRAARAGAVQGELLDCSNEMVRDRASTFILGLADIAPASAPALSVNLNIKAGYEIDLSDDPPPMRTIPHV